jgi:hypothetical protein
MAAILRKTDSKVKQRSKEYEPRITGVDKRRNLWFFQTGKYIQRLRAIPRPGTKTQNIQHMDLLVTCSCPFWKWQGPEHWAKSLDYLYNRNQTKGTAAFPEIRDPKHEHGICKHLVAVFDFAKKNKLKIDPQGRSAGRLSVDSGLTVEDLVLQHLSRRPS